MTRTSKQTYVLIWNVVRQIPYGKVATYGEIAEESGFPGQARLVGYALHSISNPSDIPWHRVINARGRISFPPASALFKRQKSLLELEGVRFDKGRIDRSKFGWLVGKRK
ncbi:MAG TPA: methylated-DNA--[protein]-cysteine S-methyltransferase [Bacteroidota bacterium]|nr:methylated-DNA--[protein]-cysteine S-methyltransferase [Bacteroidota bacterium]